jgi:hypothetical protein
MSNRAERRAAGPEPTPTERAAQAAVAQIPNRRPAGPPQDTPLRIFGAQGEPLTIAGQPFTTTVLTSAGAIDVQNTIARMTGVDAETIGEQLVGFALMVQDMRGVRGLLEKLIAEPLPEGIEYAAVPGELIEAINVAFKQSGLAWLERIQKNSGSLEGKAIEREIARLVEEALTERLAQVPATPANAAGLNGTANGSVSTTS